MQAARACVSMPEVVAQVIGSDTLYSKSAHGWKAAPLERGVRHEQGRIS